MNQLPTRLNRQMEAAVAIVRDYIDQHPFGDKGIDHYTEMAATNRKLLQKAFKHKHGIKISEYQLKKRMEEAAKMLEEGRLSKKQIACRCGYQSANNFSRAFKKVFGLSPKQWQNEYPEEVDLQDIKED